MRAHQPRTALVVKATVDACASRGQRISLARQEVKVVTLARADNPRPDIPPQQHAVIRWLPAAARIERGSVQNDALIRISEQHRSAPLADRGVFEVEAVRVVSIRLPCHGHRCDSAPPSVVASGLRSSSGHVRPAMQDRQGAVQLASRGRSGRRWRRDYSVQLGGDRRDRLTQRGDLLLQAHRASAIGRPVQHGTDRPLQPAPVSAGQCAGSARRSTRALPARKAAAPRRQRGVSAGTWSLAHTRADASETYPGGTARSNGARVSRADCPAC
jgi:hypothetical protein